MHLTVLALVTVLLNGRRVRAKEENWILDYDFTGYSTQMKLLVTECQDIHQQINQALCGTRRTARCMEMPTTNKNLPHITCVNDTLMGKAVNFTLYKTDDDSLTKLVDRQRIEIKVSRMNPVVLDRKANSYIYAWWFYLSPNLKIGDKFFHIFQLKTTVDNNPVLTFTLTKKNSFHIRWRNEKRPGVISESKQTILDLQDVLGRWVQAFIQVHYRNGTSSSHFRIILKDENGLQLFPLNNATGLFPCNNCNSLRNKGDLILPKWGLYRVIDQVHQTADWQLIQNVQIWRIQNNVMTHNSSTAVLSRPTIELRQFGLLIFFLILLALYLLRFVVTFIIHYV